MVGAVLHFQIGGEALTKLGEVFSQEFEILLLLHLGPIISMDVARWVIYENVEGLQNISKNISTQ